MINRPHEDYPQRVKATAEMIQYHIDQDVKFITDYMYKSIHGYVGADINPRHRGVWRDTYVTVGRFQPCPPYLVETEIQERGLSLIAFEGLTDEDIIHWYEDFQTVHPFIDLNGRVGGIIAAVASHYISNGEYLLAPCQ